MNKKNKSDEKSFQKSKMIKKLILTIIVADAKELDQKRKSEIYIKAFIEIYNWQNKKLVYKIYRIVKLEKYLILNAENPLNLNN